MSALKTTAGNVGTCQTALDAALITFDEDGKAIFGNRLSAEGKAALAARFGDRRVPFTGRHQKYLQRRRARFAANQARADAVRGPSSVQPIGRLIRIEAD